MSLSDRFRSLINKKKDEAQTPPPTSSTPMTPARTSQTLDEIGRLIAQERSEGEAKQQALETELRDIRASLEKMEITSKSSRETQNQTLQFLQQDAEREIKYFERKLREDMAHWDKQLKEREKALEQALKQGEAGHMERKTAFEEQEASGREAAERTESLLKEQEAKLLEERQRWRELLQTKENELLKIRQELAKREADLDKEIKQQEAQKIAAQELWQTRLKELERQWAEKRKAWEDAMKAKEEERTRLHSSFQEKAAAWQLEQERKIQEVTRRQERAHEKLAALKAHLVKETQNWQQLSQSRDEQVQQLKVKVLLSESESKGQLDQAQKTFQESVGHITGQIQVLQQQVQEEQDTWQKQLDAKEQEIHGVKEDFHGKLRQMEADFNRRLTVLHSEKETLNAEFQNLQTEYQEALARYTQHVEKMKTEQAALESTHVQRMAELKTRGEEESAALGSQISALEKQKEEGERELETIRVRWQEELRAKEQALKEAQTAVAPQEAELRKRYASEEEMVTRQVEGLKTRLRTLERDLARTQENIVKVEKEQAAIRQALESDQRSKEEALRQRSGELVARLQKRLEERRLALDAFLVMKKDEETRIQGTLRANEKERLEVSSRLKSLPQDLEKALQNKKQAVQKESEQLRGRLSALEAQLLKTREESKTIVQAKATQLASLRQSLEQKSKEVASTLRAQEQVMESERVQIEKQITAGQAEGDRIRAHWQEEIDKKEKEIQALQEELHKQEMTYRQTLEQEQNKFEDERKPLERERQKLTEALEKHRTEHARALGELENEKAQVSSQIQKAQEQERADKAAMETRFRDERAKWKARLETLASEREGVLRSGRETFDEKKRQIEQLEEQIRTQAVTYEARRRDLIHQATQKSRTLQDIIRQIEHELKTTQELLPHQLQERETVIAKLQEDLAAAQAEHQNTLGRFERARATLERRGRQKEESLGHALREAQEEWAKKLAERDSEIAALQSNLLAKESERQGELDRLAKQFAEERFQLEKSKEELEWKLKDRKEVSERQLASRQKEIQAVESEIHRSKTQHDLEVAQKSSFFEVEKQKLQTTLASLQKQIEDTRRTQEAALAAKEQELQELLARSKEHLRVLGEEFNQKVGSWRATNESLRAQIEQLKTHVAQAQDHWEALRKEKANEIGALRQELAQWEARIRSDAEEFERVFNQERQALISQIRKGENDLQETVKDYERRLAGQDEEMVRSTEKIHSQEQNTEAQWHAALEQWQTDKQALQQQKAHLEQELVTMQNRFQVELRQTDESMAKLKMDIAFKETHAAGETERLQAQMQRDMDPLRDRLARLTSEEESERNTWEVRLRAKDDELKNLKARLALREKRIQEESRRRAGELDKLRRQVDDEVKNARERYDAERSQFEKQLMERREALAKLQASENECRQSAMEAGADLACRMQREREQLEDGLRQILSQREALRERYEALFGERNAEAEALNRTLDSKEQELEALRAHAKEQADAMRRKMDALRHAGRRRPAKNGGPTSAVAWNAFELGVKHYQSQQWAEAAHAFEDCLRKDSRWGAAYQYLALAYHAQGNTARAAEIAAQAKKLDPENTQLASWVERLNAASNERKAS